jgi:hypothetical protein
MMGCMARLMHAGYEAGYGETTPVRPALSRHIATSARHDEATATTRAAVAAARRGLSLERVQQKWKPVLRPNALTILNLARFSGD